MANKLTPPSLLYSSTLVSTIYQGCYQKKNLQQIIDYVPIGNYVKVCPKTAQIMSQNF